MRYVTYVGPLFHYYFRPDSKNALHISAPNKTAPHKNKTNNNAPNENAPIVNLHLYEIIFKNTMKAQFLFDLILMDYLDVCVQTS